MKLSSNLLGIPRWGRVLLFQLLLVIVVIQFTDTPARATQEAQDFSFTAPTTSTGMITGLRQVLNYVFWIFYLVGGIFLGIGCYKLKQGDMPGFGTNVAGGVALFFVPALIHLFMTLGTVASAN